MNKHPATMPMEAKSAKFSGDSAQGKRRTVGRLPSSPMRWWRQSICFPVIFFIVTTYVDRASAATLVNGANQTGIIFTNTVADSYTFAANTGDSINLRLGTTNFFGELDRKSTRLNSSHLGISYAVFCLKKK